MLMQNVWNETLTAGEIERSPDSDGPTQREPERKREERKRTDVCLREQIHRLLMDVRRFAARRLA